MHLDADVLRHSLKRYAPAADHVSLRALAETSERVRVRQDVPEPITARADIGAMVTVVQGDGIGYAATSDLSETGIRLALDQANTWARLTRGRNVFAGTQLA